MPLEGQLTDDEIRELWAESFPKRHDNIRAMGMCEALRLTIENRAVHTGASEQSIIFELDQILDTIGIARDEFYQVESEAEGD